MKIENMRLADLKPYEGNAKKHDEKQIKNVMESIKQYGIVQPLVADKNNVLIIGHCRLIASKRLKLQTVPVVRLEDLDEAEANKLRLLDNKLNESEWDMELLAEQIPSLDFSGFDIDWEIPGLPEEEIELEEDEVPEDPVTMAKTGDIWHLGRHRLLCGDSTCIEDIQKLMAGETCDLVVTDPPYNVNYEGGTGLKIQNDNMEDAAFRAFLRSAFICLDSVMKPGAPFYIWHADSEGYNFRGACRDVGWQVRQCIIWNKNSFVLGRQDYQWKHEPCLYGWKDGAVHYFIDNRSQATVYQDQEELEPRKMTKKRVKKPKAKHPSDRLSTENVIRYTQYLCLASVLLTLWGVYGVQEQEKAEEFLESYVSFLEEKMDGRNSIGGIVEDCIDMTGFDPITIIDKIYERRSEVKRK